MNPEKKQDRAFDAFDHFERFGFILFPENKAIYQNIRSRFTGSILEAGCGNGVGSYILGTDMATDKLKRNVDFAKELYPDMEFDIWDIVESPYKGKYDVVVAIEMLEHTDFEKGLKNLIASASKEVWFSTPNQSQKNPDNPYHVREYDVKEVLKMIENYKTKILHWKTFKELDKNTKVNPLVYKIIL